MKVSSLVLIGLSIGLFSCAKSEATPSTPQGVAAAAAGNEGPNGGNFEAQEVARLSGELLMILKQSAPTYPEVDVQKFETALLKTKLFVVPVIFENGRELDASNNGTDEIKINQMRWRLKCVRLHREC